MPGCPEMIAREVLPIPFKEREMSDCLQLLQLRLKASDSLETLISSSPLKDSAPGFSSSSRMAQVMWAL